MNPRRKLLLIAGSLMALSLIYFASPAYPYLNQFTAGAPDHWDFAAFPVMWNLNPAIGSNIQGSRTVTDVIQSSFNAWTSAPNAALPISRGADSAVNAEANSPSKINLICFTCSDGDFTKDATTLAVTLTTTSDQAGQSDGHGGSTLFAGQIIKGDILFNPASSYSTDGTGGVQDLQTVATHEIGHFFGLDHSGVVRAMMFPFAPDNQHVLSYDDVAAISVLYPKATPDFAVGSISGTVRMSGSGAGVFGAHVYAGSTTAAMPIPGNIRKTPVGTLTRPDGSYHIQGVPLDSYIVTAEPLDDPVTNSDVAGYAPAFGQGAVQTNFTTRWH